MKDNIDFVLERLDPYLEKYFKNGKGSLDEDIREIVAVWLLDSEVNNGGFDQFYWNPAGEFALDAVEGLESIGAYQKASILDAANSEFPGGMPSENRIKRQEELDVIVNSESSKLGSLDIEYFKCKEDIVDLLASYFRNE